ncbi:MAG: hypothetical protein QOI62_2428 [Solirubrobacteraceae bacterium]|nr:hypothetical protein [Solirubrobacteraceae bacterium]
MVERGGLENRWSRKWLQGSNPCPSARIPDGHGIPRPRRRSAVRSGAVASACRLERGRAAAPRGRAPLACAGGRRQGCARFSLPVRGLSAHPPRRATPSATAEPRFVTRRPDFASPRCPVSRERRRESGRACGATSAAAPRRRRERRRPRARPAAPRANRPRAPIPRAPRQRPSARSRRAIRAPSRSLGRWDLVRDAGVERAAIWSFPSGSALYRARVRSRTGFRRPCPDARPRARRRRAGGAGPSCRTCRRSSSGPRR